MLVSLWQTRSTLHCNVVTLQRGYIAMPAAPALFNGCRGRRHTVTRLGGGRYDLSPSECIWSEGMS
jgi:hypothetical protein